jgi:hypothetical protein
VIPRVAGLSSADTVVLKSLYDFFVANGLSYIDPAALVDDMERKGVEATMVAESLEVLDHQGYAEVLQHIGPGPYSSRIASLGVSAILGQAREQQLMKAVGLSLVNSKRDQSSDIATEIGENEFLVNHCVDRLEGQGLIKAARSLDGSVYIHTISPMLRRALS